MYYFDDIERQGLVSATCLSFRALELLRQMKWFPTIDSPTFALGEVIYNCLPSICAFCFAIRVFGKGTRTLKSLLIWLAYLTLLSGDSCGPPKAAFNQRHILAWLLMATGPSTIDPCHEVRDSDLQWADIDSWDFTYHATMRPCTFLNPLAYMAASAVASWTLGETWSFSCCWFGVFSTLVLTMGVRAVGIKIRKFELEDEELA